MVRLCCNLSLCLYNLPFLFVLHTLNPVRGLPLFDSSEAKSSLRLKNYTSRALAGSLERRQLSPLIRAYPVLLTSSDLTLTVSSEGYQLRRESAERSTASLALHWTQLYTSSGIVNCEKERDPSIEYERLSLSSLGVESLL